MLRTDQKLEKFSHRGDNLIGLKWARKQSQTVIFQFCSIFFSVIENSSKLTKIAKTKTTNSKK